MAVHLGIDLGTTYSTVAAARNGRVELLSLGTRGAAVPSVVFVRADGPPLVGEAAEARAQGDPSRFAREFKRRLGDPTPLILGGVPMGAERLSGDVLAYLVGRATERLGEAPAGVVLTHPASYTQYRLDLLGEAVHLAGLDGARLLAEPQAAALHYAADNRVQDGETVAVYDFGGGTFDAALVRRHGDEFDLVGEPQGIDRFGGIDIDLTVFDYVCDEASDLVNDIDGDDPVNRAMLSRLRSDCRLAKERLSADTETVVGVTTSRGARDVVVTRRLLESMIRSRLADTVQALERAVRTAGLATSDVSRVLLVGGSSRIPLVRTLLTESFGRPVSVDADPEPATTVGAAAAAARWAAEAPVPAAPSSTGFAAPVVGAAAATAAAGGPVGASTARGPEPVDGPPPAPPDEIPPTPGSRPPAPKPSGSKRWIIVVGAAVVALVVAAVIFFVTRDPGSDDSSSGTTGSASPTVDPTETTTGPIDTLDGGDGEVQIGDAVGINPPDDLVLTPMAGSDLDTFRSLATVPGSEGRLDVVLGSDLQDRSGTPKGALIRFVNGGGDLGIDAQTAIVEAILAEESVVDGSELQHVVDGIEGTEFAYDDGRSAWAAPVGGEVVLLLTTSSNPGELHQRLDELAGANAPLVGTTTSSSAASATTVSPTTVVFDIADVSFGDLNSVDPTINPPAGFHFEPLNETQIGFLRTSAAIVGPRATSLHTVIGSPLYPDDGTPPPGGIIMYLGDGTAEFQQQVADALIDDGSAPSPFRVGAVVGTLFTRGDGTQGWVGPFHESAILVSIDTVDPDHVALKAVLDGLGAANP